MNLQSIYNHTTHKCTAADSSSVYAAPSVHADTTDHSLLPVPPRPLLVAQRVEHQHAAHLLAREREGEQSAKLRAVHHQLRPHFVLVQPVPAGSVLSGVKLELCLGSANLEVMRTVIRRTRWRGRGRRGESVADGGASGWYSACRQCRSSCARGARRPRCGVERSVDSVVACGVRGVGAWW